ncbi:DNA ligase [Candidatus Micrarchaeota archaeon]|nr:MAG: DNA ligase [Candidatus Micrarchaeota archaeon]
MKFYFFAKALEQMADTESRNEMTDILAGVLKKASPKEARIIAYLLQGEIGPQFKKLKLNIAENFCSEAMAKAFGKKKKSIKENYGKAGDLGDVARKLSKKEKHTLELKQAYSELKSIAESSGAGSHQEKLERLASLLKKAAPLEAKYLARMVVGDLRVGASTYTFLDALSLAKTGKGEFREELERQYNNSSDLGLVAEEFMKKGKDAFEASVIQLYSPLRPQLAQRASSADEILESMKKAAIEPKYDGFRVQLHCKGKKVKLYSRNLKETTDMFPEIVKAARKQIKEEAIIDGEALAYDENTESFYPFQITIQRKRKYGVEEKMKELPLRMFAFDLLYKKGKSLMQLPYRKRKEELKRIIKKGKTIEVAEETITGKSAEIKELFEKYLDRDLEGLMAKDPNSHYIAGARKHAWLKLKQSYRGKLADTVDVVILGYLRGKGKRAKLGIGALIGGVYNEREDGFETIAKIGSGLSEKQTKKLKKMLDKIRLKKKPKKVKSKLDADVWVKAKYVIEVTADQITRSPTHTCASEKGKGLSLRFPRTVSFIRADKDAKDATTTSEIRRMFEKQKK